MKTIKTKLILIILGCTLTTGMKCEKDNQQLNNDQLPAITQNGANTFGFLLNGEVWLPKAPILKQKLDLSYDPNYNGGTFNIIAKKHFNNGDYQSVSISSSNMNSIGTYPISIDKSVVYFYNTTSCKYHWNENFNTQTGILTISKIDLTNKFISGTFEFKLEKEGCPTINATQGRFDLKIE